MADNPNATKDENEHGVTRTTKDPPISPASGGQPEPPPPPPKPQ